MFVVGFLPQVRVRNLTYLQPFSPTLVVAHTRVRKDAGYTRI